MLFFQVPINEVRHGDKDRFLELLGSSVAEITDPLVLEALASYGNEAVCAWAAESFPGNGLVNAWRAAATGENAERVRAFLRAVSAAPDGWWDNGVPAEWSHHDALLSPRPLSPFDAVALAWLVGGEVEMKVLSSLFGAEVVQTRPQIVRPDPMPLAETRLQSIN